MAKSSVIDLSKLPAPKVIEDLDYEILLQNCLDDFLKRNSDYSTLLESDPVIILLQVFAYRELLLRNRINQAAKANMLAYASGSDLDNLAAFYSVKRLENETDERLRQRTQLALEGFSTAGPIGAYIFHALSASSAIKSVAVKSENPGEVLVTILSNIANGQASQELINIVLDKLNHDDIRPLTDWVKVQSADIINYDVKAVITVYSGPSSLIVKEKAEADLKNFINERHAIGKIIAISGIYNALHVNGVKKVQLITPATDIITSNQQAAFCNNIEISIASDE